MVVRAPFDERDNRSALLFGGFFVWAILSIVLINRREGEWVKPEAAGWGREIRGLVISIVIFLVFMWLHRWITGIAIM